MSNTLSSLWKFLVNLGINENESLYDKKIKRFFNVLTFFGGISGFLQVAMVYPYDIYAASFHLIWSLFCIIALIIHSFDNFKLARFLTLFFVLIFGGLASARLGQEFYPHFASFGIVIACFIMYDLKKEWAEILFFMAIEIMMVSIVETNIFKSETVIVQSPFAFRVTIILGTMAFVITEFIFFCSLKY